MNLAIGFSTEPMLTLRMGRKRVRLDRALRVRGPEIAREPCPRCRAGRGTLCWYPRRGAWSGYHASRTLAAAWRKHYTNRLDPGKRGNMT